MGETVTASYEEACKISSKIMTRESFLTKGVRATCDEYKAALGDVGWTLDMLIEESGRRIRERFKVNP